MKYWSKNTLFGMKDYLQLVFLAFVVGSLLIQVVNPIFYDITSQHDAPVHLVNLASWIQGVEWHGYDSPVYLEWYAFHRFFVYPFRGFISDAAVQMQIYIGIANFNLFIILLSGIYFLGKKLDLSQRQIFLWLALSGSMVPLHRSLNMVRPENIQLALSPWLVLAGISWFQDVRSRGLFLFNFHFFIFHFLGSLIVFQKIGGVTILVPIYFIGLFSSPINKKYIRNAALSVLIVILLVAAYSGVWYKVSGNFFLSNHANEDPAYVYSAPLSLFTTFPLGKLFETPYRNELKTSMWAILSADFFGDYWRYGYNAFKFTRPPWNDSVMLFRQRLGSVITIIYFVMLASVCACECIFIWRKKADTYSVLRILILGLLPLLFGLLYLGAVSQTQFNPLKADIVKWEYLLFAIPFLNLPIVYFASWIKSQLSSSIYYGICFIFLVVGLAQSIFIRWN